ncbi:MAG: hypothetical protein H7288_12445 [Kineosporiaceae bacterium]|nr:hypothetical protein [Aeromicrobium sp.]
MSDQKYEYVVVELPTSTKTTREVVLTDRLNSVAEHGWWLQTTSLAYDRYAKTPFEYAILER